VVLGPSPGWTESRELIAAFNGPNHDEDPKDKGYILPDGEHPSEAGAQVIAEAFRKLGYVPIVP
jgi:lysophospholipase L1-like esterase